MLSPRPSRSALTSGISKRCSRSDPVVTLPRTRRVTVRLLPATERSLLAWAAATYVRASRGVHEIRGQHAPTLSPGTCGRGSRKTPAGFSHSTVEDGEQHKLSAFRRFVDARRAAADCRANERAFLALERSSDPGARRGRAGDHQRGLRLR